jgi:flagellar biosynthetic protein FlhB
LAEQDSGERSEKATPRKQQKAREKGQVPRSKELTTALVLLASPLSLMAISGKVAESFVGVSQLTFAVNRSYLFDDHYMFTALAESVLLVFSALALFFMVVFVVSALVPMLMGGLTFNMASIAPKGNRLSPFAGFKRMFGLNAAVELGKAIGKFLLIALVAYWVINANFFEYLSLGHSTPQQEVIAAIHYILAGLLSVSASLIIIALIDVPYQMWNHARQLKMTKQEIKDEYKETEGKPEVKSRIRQLQRELAHRRMMEAIPDADVVVTNPEHYSVALKYDQFSRSAPVVIAKGVDEVAMNIRKVAIAHDVPILQAPPLARALYHTTKLDHEIPSELYLAVAQVLAYVFQLHEYRKGRAAKPKPIGDLPIPDSMQY